MAEVAFGFAGFALGVLLGANAVVIVARIAGNERLARAVVELFSRVTWLFKLGGDGQGRRGRGLSGTVRA